ncbi:MAG TPA: arsenite methyltransferase [Nocardioides sp.]|uniref:arsenite methyltransferase n=1 Tax=Nocardioides sp. TaxID=35761 RepID=UPI002C16B3B7|nr:arsenite methyltransferase [Nocardioides sp.]HQR25456.1 arsenite methyltransferase [Nocardioides sp.]
MPTTETSRDPEQLRDTVREHYAAVASAAGSGCCGGGPQPVSLSLGYTPDDLTAVPDGADLGLGCGNPQALARLEPGMTVLDLGCGAGFDVFLAARAVGEEGLVIGVDMTPEMLAKARANARTAGYRNVDFRLGEIEHLPVADASVDVVISNCVINLSPDKQAVFAEAFRVLRPGGRLAVSDVVAFAELPEEVRGDLALYAGCVAGAATAAQTCTMLEQAGFADLHVTPLDHSREVVTTWAPGLDLADYVASASIEATRPA